MKRILPTIRHYAALAGVALGLSAGMAPAQTIITNSYTNTFDTGGNTTYFAGTGSVASWIYWYNTPGNNLQVTNDPSMDAEGSSTSGSMLISSPFANTPGTQNLFFGTFDNGYGYDFNTRADLTYYSNLTCKIHVAPGTVPSSSGNFGFLQLGFITASYGFSSLGNATIPLSATNGWVTLSLPIDHTAAYASTPVPGIGLDYNNYSGYPSTNVVFWIDDLALVGSTAPPPPPPKFVGSLAVPVQGLNSIGTSKSTYQRYHICTSNDVGYTFVGRPSVTYSWSIAQFPTNSDWQAHVFLVNGPVGTGDTAADYNRAQCVFLKIGSGGPGLPAYMDFRYKTNEAAGNGMLFNALSPTNAANTNHWPVMPIASINDPSGPIGNWSITFANTTNVTITTPSGLTTNFFMDAASAALFADPMQICVGGQANGTVFFGQSSVITKFAVTGAASSFTDTFAADAALNTNFWFNLSNDTNGIVLVPPGSAYWVDWTLPDNSFALQVKSNLSKTTVATSLSGLGTILNFGNRQALVAKTNLPSGKQGYFSLVKRSFSQLQILLPGETNAPNTSTGKTGTPTPANTTSATLVTVNAVDSNFNIINSVTDTISVGSSDGSAFLPNNAAMVNGTVTFNTFVFQTTGSQTVTATDVTNSNIPTATSSSVTVTP